MNNASDCGHTANILTKDQNTAITRLFETDATILVAPTGAGKTVICLTAIAELIAGRQLKRVIVACPARVLDVWAREQAKWKHLSHLTVTVVRGSGEERRTLLAESSEVVVCSLNNLAWLLEHDHGCNGIAIDELSKASGMWTRGLKSKKKAGMLVWRCGMTATPVSQDFQRVYNLARIIDGGASLGTSQEMYLNTYFYSDYGGFTWTLRDGAIEMIMKKISGLVHHIEDTKMVELPELILVEQRFDMPEATRQKYNEMRKDFVTGADENSIMIEAANEAVKSGKLRQLGSGFIYADEEGHKDAFPLDAARIDALAEYVQAFSERRKVIIFYEFIGQLGALKSAIPYTTESIEEFTNDEEKWFLLAQISAFSHGIEGLQHICHDAVMYHPMWSRDATQQAIGRLWRRGQNQPVTVTTLVCNDTLDDLVLKRVEGRGEFMEMFMKHMNQ